MKTRNHRKVSKSLLVLVSSIILVSCPGCSFDEHEPKTLEARSLQPFLTYMPESGFPKKMSLETITRRIDNSDTQVTFITGDQLGVSSSLGVVQPMRVKYNHRFTGVSFFIRSLSAPCTLTSAIIPDNSSDAFIHTQPISLTADIWRKIELSFKNFSHVSTFLNRDTDCFNSVYWDKINLFLVFSECDQEKQGIEWGSVQVIRQNKLYRFYE